jgi:glycosyltransferase involved in cell wall biosynthesis
MRPNGRIERRSPHERAGLPFRDDRLREAREETLIGEAGALEMEKAPRRLTICFVGTPWLAVQGRTGGIPKTLSELSRVMARDHEVHIVCPTPRFMGSSRAGPGVQFHYAPVLEVRQYPIRDQLDLSLPGIALVLRLVFAVVVMGALYSGLRRKHQLDVTYLSNKYVAAPLLLLRGKRKPGAFIYSERNIWPWLHPVPVGGWARLRYKANVFLGKFVCQRSDAVHVLSESLRDAMADHGMDRRIIAPIPNGIDVQVREVEPPPLSPPIRVGFVGRLIEVKGIRILVGAIRKLNAARPDVQFDVFGDGPLRPLLDNGRLQNCRIWGDRPREEVLDALRSIHIALFLSPIENVPSNALLEALAMGKAVVATGVGDTTRVLTDGRNAVLCAPDSAAVADAVDVLCRTAGLYETVTAGARELALGYAWEKVAGRHLEVYMSALASGAA